MFVISILTGYYLYNSRYLIKDVYSADNIHVKIAGVKNPGFYTLKKGDTLKLLIEKSGGLVDKSDIYYVDMDKKLQDGDIIDIGVLNGRK